MGVPLVAAQTVAPNFFTAEGAGDTPFGCGRFCFWPRWSFIGAAFAIPFLLLLIAGAGITNAIGPLWYLIATCGANHFLFLQT